ncbi:MAG: class I SAM-dependent methyltransferase [Deltaproteobacteria bacterium]|nr:class I SAM-dependent methyltransferase [Deltaproteobacteria bacterium]
MYTENPVKDAVIFCKAFLSNQLAKFAPKLYVKLTHQTGRGGEEGDGSQVANYFFMCFDDYLKQLGVKIEHVESYLKNKLILEYGPGDILGVALLFYAYGAETVHCVDRFPLSKMSEKNIDIYVQLLNSLGGKERKRAEAVFKEKGNPASGFNEHCIRYKVTKNGLSGANNAYDLIISRAVLEHVNDLKETMFDVKRCLKKDGLSLHEVDLRSHGLDRYTDFDFLTWPTFLYALMYSHKGFPNRWRVSTYKELANSSRLHVKELKPTGRLDQSKLSFIRPKIAKEFRLISPDELSWLGFWVHLEHA